MRELTGFPFPIGGARVYRVEGRGGAGGLRQAVVRDLEHVLAPVPEGAVIKVAPNGVREIIADGLFFPGGLALGATSCT